MKILGFAGSNSSESINKQLVEYTTSLFEHAEVEILDLNDYEMPIYGIDKENSNGIPQLAHDFAEKIDNADLLVVSLAENNGAYSVAFKNVFDWMSRISGRSAFGDKPMLLMATSPGGKGGKFVLEMAKNRMPFSGGKVLETFSLPKFDDNFNEGKGIINEELNTTLRNKVEKVQKIVHADFSNPG